MRKLEVIIREVNETDISNEGYVQLDLPIPGMVFLLEEVNTHHRVLSGSNLFKYMADNLTRDITSRVAWLGLLEAYRDKDIR